MAPLDSTTENSFDSTAVLTGQNPADHLIVPKGQLRHHLPPHITYIRTHTAISRTPITVYFAEAKQEEMMIVGCSGFKHDEILDFDQIERLNQQGVSVMWVGLPNPRRKADFVEHFIHAGTDMLLDPQDPDIAEWLNRDVPKVFHGHSTGAQLFFHLMRNNETFDKLMSAFNGATLSSTALEYPVKILHAAFHLYATMHPDEIPHETALGKLYLKKLGIEVPDIPDTEVFKKYLEQQAYVYATYPQMLEIEKYGNIAKKEIYDSTSNVNNRGDFEIMMFSGKQDWVANAKPQRKAAKAINALHVQSDTSYHAPLTQDTECFSTFEEGVKSMGNLSFTKFRREFEMNQGGARSRLSYFRRKTQAAAEVDSPDNAPHAF